MKTILLPTMMLVPLGATWADPPVSIGFVPVAIPGGIPVGIAATVTSVNGVPPIATKTVTGPGTVVSVTASSTPGGWSSATGSAYSYSSSSQTP